MSPPVLHPASINRCALTGCAMVLIAPVFCPCSGLTLTSSAAAPCWSEAVMSHCTPSYKGSLSGWHVAPLIEAMLRTCCANFCGCRPLWRVLAAGLSWMRCPQ